MRCGSITGWRTPVSTLRRCAHGGRTAAAVVMNAHRQYGRLRRQPWTRGRSTIALVYGGNQPAVWADHPEKSRRAQRLGGALSKYRKGAGGAAGGPAAGLKRLPTTPRNRADPHRQAWLNTKERYLGGRIMNTTMASANATLHALLPGEANIRISDGMVLNPIPRWGLLARQLSRR